MYSVESLLRQQDKYGRPKWRDPEEEERKRLAKERNNAAYARLLQKEKEKQQQQRAAINQVHTPNEPETQNSKPETHKVLTPKGSEIPGTRQVVADGTLYTEETLAIYTDIGEACYLSHSST